jgi:hypothetical protein
VDAIFALLETDSDAAEQSHVAEAEGAKAAAEAAAKAAAEAAAKAAAEAAAKAAAEAAAKAAAEAAAKAAAEAAAKAAAEAAAKAAAEAAAKAAAEAAAKAAAEAAAKAAAEADPASTVFCEVVESLWAAVLARNASSEITCRSIVQRVLVSDSLNKSNITAHKFVPAHLFKLVTESALNVSLPSTHQSPTSTRIVDCVLKCLLLQRLAMHMQCEHFLDGLFDPSQECISNQHLLAACSRERARPAAFPFPSWTIHTAMQRTRGRLSVCQPADVLCHLRTDSFSETLSRRFSAIHPLCIFVPSILASVCSSFPSSIDAVFCLTPFTLDISSAELVSETSQGETCARRNRHCSTMNPVDIQRALEDFGFRDSDFDCSIADVALVVESAAKSPARKEILQSIIRAALDSGRLVTCARCLDCYLRRHTVIPCKNRFVCASLAVL